MRLTALAMACLAAAFASAVLISVQAQDDSPYLGVDTCKQCHEEEYEAWGKTPHARAFRVIHWRDDEPKTQCLPCHTTGYGKQGGFTLPADTPEYANVQCEACHGPGREHLDGMGAKDKITRVPRASVCSGCHMHRNVH